MNTASGSPGGSYQLRAWLEKDYARAEADYRRGLALSPNSAAGYERFARLLFFFPDANGQLDARRRAEAFALIDRARELDPLAPSAHLTKALMQLYGRSDIKAANALMLEALEQDPNYYPALMRLAELRWCCQGEFAEAIRYGERALALEPGASWPQRILLEFYLDVGELDAARQVLKESKERDPVGQIPLYLYEREWQKAGEVALSRMGSMTAFDRNMAVWAVSQYAHATRERARPRGYLEDVANIAWNAEGEPTINDSTHDMVASVELAAILRATGDRTRAERLLRFVLSEQDRVSRDLERGEMWWGNTRPQALALLGETDAALAALQKSFDTGFYAGWWYRLVREHAYDELRGDPRFVALLDRMRAHAAEQHNQLDAMRAAGVVPKRVAISSPVR